MDESADQNSANRDPFAEPADNPFRAPRVPSIVEPSLSDDDDFLITPKVILCREVVRLPPVCIHLGETEGVEERNRRLRVLPLPGALRVLAAAFFFIFLPLFLPFSGFGLFWGPITRLVILGGFAMLFLLFVWAARSYVDAVDATWFVCGRYKRQMKLYRWVVRICLTGAAIGMAVANAESAGSFGLFLPLTVFVVSFLFNPETGLQLVGRKHNGFLLNGHSKRFYETVVHTQSGAWTERRVGTQA